MEKSIKEQIKERILNYDEISEKPEFDQWVKNVFSDGLMAVDKGNIYGILDGKKVDFKAIVAGSVEEFKEKCIKEITPEISGIITSAKIPKSINLDGFNQIAESITSRLKDNTKIEWQVVQHPKETIEAVFLTF